MINKSVLFVDDAQERIDSLLSITGADNIYLAKDLAEAILQLKSRKYDIISLDHDIPYVEKENGKDLCHWMNAHFSPLEKQTTPVVVHSQNLPGAVGMYELLVWGGFKIVMISPYNPPITASILKHL